MSAYVLGQRETLENGHVHSPAAAALGAARDLDADSEIAVDPFQALARRQERPLALP